jgi:hypothetical protein
MTNATLTRKQLQATLKGMRFNGMDVQIKLNTTTEAMQAEYNRLTSSIVINPYPDTAWENEIKILNSLKVKFKVNQSEVILAEIKKAYRNLAQLMQYRIASKEGTSIHHQKYAEYLNLSV